MYAMVTSVLLSITLLIDGMTYMSGRADHSWGTFGLIVFFTPAFHAGLALVSLVAGVALRSAPGFTWGKYAPLCTLIPLAGFLVTEAALLSIQVHGC